VYLTGNANPDFAREVDEFVGIMRTRPCYVFWAPTFDPIVTAEELNRRIPLEVVAKDGDETLYGVAPSIRGQGGGSRRCCRPRRR
jgi:hypothetical protein